ncbi:MAG: DUF4358 domain-containing protein, partial [Oscillospiraceae bacterium]
MKKTGIFALVLSAILLTACNNGSSSESSAGSTSSSSSTQTESSSETSTAAEKKADLYAEAALNAVEFPKMTKVETADEIDAFFEFNTANYADFSLYMNVMSVNLNRVLIVKPLPDKHDEVYAELKAYFDDLITNNAFYPAQESAAAGAKMGETADGYIYVIVHEDGETAVQAIQNAVMNNVLVICAAG